MSLQVIGVGLPRTGTLSLKLALEQLGFGPAHHMTEIYRLPERWDLWRRAAGGEAVDWDRVFAGFSSTTDAPGCCFAAELSAFYPTAKVILTIRNPDDWIDSVSETVFSPKYAGEMANSPFKSVGALLSAKLRSTPGLAPPDFSQDRRQIGLGAYRAHNAHVQRIIPADRLLVYNVAEGWEPLCQFLGVPTPRTAFPNQNQRKEFFERMRPPVLEPA